MIRNLIFWLILSPHIASATTAQYGTIPSQFKAGFFSMGAELNYLSTSANYTDKGTSLDFMDQHSYSAIQTLLYGRYDLTNELSMFSEIPMNYAQSENPTDTYSSFKFPGLSFGANYNIDFSSFRVIPQVRGYYAIEKFDKSVDQVLTSDGTSYLDLGSHLFINFSNFIMHGFLSYQYRMDGFSGLLNYQTDLTYKAQTFSLAFGLRGFESVTKDEYSDIPSYRHAYLNIVNGGSFIYGSVDPSRMDVFSLAKYALFPSLDMYGGIAKSLRGKNSGDMLTLTFGLEYFFGGPSQSTPYSSGSESFELESETIDPKIEEEIRTYNKPKPKKKPKKKPRPKPRTNSNRTSPENNLEISRKQMGKKSTSTSPVKPKPRSKKPTRVNIDF